MELWIVILALVGVTLLSGNLIGITLILFGVVLIQYTFDGNFSVLGNGVWNLFNSFALTALPVFIFLVGRGVNVYFHWYYW